MTRPVERPRIYRANTFPSVPWRWVCYHPEGRFSAHWGEQRLALADALSHIREYHAPDDVPRCIKGCGRLAVGERVAGMVGEDELVELVCYQHLTEGETGT